MAQNYNPVSVDASLVLKAIHERRSVRRYLPTSVPRETLELILDAAHWAPSAHNRQPWRFAVIEAEATKQTLAMAMGNQLRADLERDGMAPAFIAQDAGRSYQRITSAPVVVIACVTMRDMDRYADARRSQAERLMASQSVAMSVQNLLLAASAMGLGACWMCAPLFVPGIVRSVLELEADWEPQALITLGYPAEAKVKERNALTTLVRYLDTPNAGESN